MIKLKDLLSEEAILRDQVDIVIALEKSEHAVERQSRVDNEGADVSNEEVLAACNSALAEIFRRFINGREDLNSRVWIRKPSSNLNIIASLNRGQNRRIKLVVITVMRKKDFKADRNSLIVV